MVARSFLDTLDYDLPGSPPFLKQLPALADAFDKEKMKILLQETLFLQANPIFRITNCIPGKALYLADHTCNLQYNLKLLNTITNKTMRTLVNARLFNDLVSCKAYYQKTLIPLSFGMSGRPEMKPFAKPVAIIEPLKMALSIFPLDGMLPSLISATDPRQLSIIFNRTLPEAIAGKIQIHDVHLDLAHYGRYQRCVLRYGMDGEQIDTGLPRHLVVYGKVDIDRQGELTVQTIDNLRKKLRDPNLPDHFRVPISYGYLPEINLLLMEELPGEPVIQRLIKEWKEGSKDGSGGSLSLDEAIKASAQILLTLHGSGIKLGRHVLLETRAAMVNKEIRIVQQVYPELGDQLCHWMDEIQANAKDCNPQVQCLSHGDYTYSQIIFEGSQGGLVDFDTICQAEPAFDLGQFIAYLRLAFQKNHPFQVKMADHLSDIFLEAYLNGSGEWVKDEQFLRNRVLVYELIGLIRLMVHSWQKFKGNRLKLAFSIFEERYPWLKQVK